MAWYDKENDKKFKERKIEQEMENARSLGSLAKGIEADRLFKGIPPESITGKFKKHYQYDKWDEVWVELYEKGALFHKAGSPHYEWYETKNVKRCLDKAKLLGSRSKVLNSMFR